MKNIKRRNEEDPLEVEVKKADDDAAEDTPLEVSEDVEAFECKYCKFETEDLDQLDEHITEAHLFEEAEETAGQDPTRNTDFSIEQDVSQNTAFSIDQNPSYEIKEEETDSGNEIYVCHVCSYETPKKKVMRKHLLKHENPYDVVYKCSECSYETRRKCDMPKHLLSHCTNVEMYKCPECPYATKRKNDLPKHLLCHRKPNEIELYECEYCDYRSKRKGDLRKHMLTHKLEKQMYCCPECPYTSVRPNDLNKHTLVHSDKELTGIFKCLRCDYATNKTNKFAKHVLSNCQMCDNAIIYSTDEYIIVEEDIDQNLQEPLEIAEDEDSAGGNYSMKESYTLHKRRFTTSASEATDGVLTGQDVFEDSGSYSRSYNVARSYTPRRSSRGYGNHVSKKIRVQYQEEDEESE